MSSVSPQWEFPLESTHSLPTPNPLRYPPYSSSCRQLLFLLQNFSSRVTSSEDSYPSSPTQRLVDAGLSSSPPSAPHPQTDACAVACWRVCWSTPSGRRELSKRGGFFTSSRTGSTVMFVAMEGSFVRLSWSRLWLPPTSQHSQNLTFGDSPPYIFETDHDCAFQGAADVRFLGAPAWFSW